MRMASSNGEGKRDKFPFCLTIMDSWYFDEDYQMIELFIRNVRCEMATNKPDSQSPVEPLACINPQLFQYNQANQ